MKPVYALIELRREGSDIPIMRFMVNASKTLKWIPNTPDCVIGLPEGHLVRFGYYGEVRGPNGVILPSEQEIQKFGAPEPALFGKRAITLENK